MTTDHSWPFRYPRHRYKGKYPEVSTVKTIWQRDKGICHLCCKPVSLRAATRDHLTPVAHGGSYWPENLKIAHKKCNGRRGTNYVSSALCKQQEEEQ